MNSLFRRTPVLTLIFAVVLSVCPDLGAQEDPSEPETPAEARSESDSGERNRDISKTIKAAREGKVDVEQSRERIQRDKEDLNREIKKLTEKVNGGGSVEAEGREAEEKALKNQLEAFKKKKATIEARQSSVREKIEAYEQAAELLEKKANLRNNEELTLGELNTMRYRGKQLKQAAVREKEQLESKLNTLDLEMRADEQALSAKKMVLELRSDAPPELVSSIEVLEEQIESAGDQMELIRERISFIDIQIELINDYSRAVQEKRWEILRYDLFRAEPYEFSLQEALFSFVFLLFFFLSIYSRRVTGIGMDGPVTGDIVPRWLRRLYLLGGPVFVLYWTLAALGYGELAGYALWNLLVVFLAAFVLSAIHKGLDLLLRGYFFQSDDEKEPPEDEKNIPPEDIMSAVAGWGLFFIGLYTVIHILGYEREAGMFLHQILQRPFFTLGKVNVSLWVILKVIFILWLFTVTAHVVNVLLKSKVYEKMHLEMSIQYTISVAVKYMMVILGVFIGLSALGVDLAALTVFAGTIGIGIGFGLQEIAKNFISGIVLLIERPVKVGDYIEVAGLPGKVRAIKARSTVVDTFDNISVVVPNSEFMTRQIVNWSYSDKLTRLKVSVGVAYGSDTELVRNTLLETAGSHPNVLKNPEPYVWFEGFNDSALDFSLFVWTNKPHNRMALKSDLNFKIDAAFRENNITIPFPQRDVHMRS